VLLLDEVEKASSYLLSLFLQAFDEGWMTDGRGKRVYLSDAIVIMTSNLGSENFKKYMQPLGFGSDRRSEMAQIKREVLSAAENRFTPEFRNRIDEIIVFSPLTRDEVSEIAQLYLGRVRQHMEALGKALTVSAEAEEWLVDKGYSAQYGARFLKRTIDEWVKVPITARWKDGDRFEVDAKGGELEIHVVR
jgi:ATP-dependent Clp protease ATP-binding subunit ClpA